MICTYQSLVSSIDTCLVPIFRFSIYGTVTMSICKIFYFSENRFLVTNVMYA